MASDARNGAEGRERRRRRRRRASPTKVTAIPTIEADVAVIANVDMGISLLNEAQSTHHRFLKWNLKVKSENY